MNDWYLAPNLRNDPYILLLGWVNGHLTLFSSDEAPEMTPSTQLAEHFFSTALTTKWTGVGTDYYTSVWSKKVLNVGRPSDVSIRQMRQRALMYSLPYAITLYGNVLDYVITADDDYTAGLEQPVYATPGAFWLIFSQPLCCRSLGRAFAWSPAEHMNNFYRAQLPQGLALFGINEEDTALVRVKFIDGGKFDWMFSGLFYYDHALAYRQVYGKDVLTFENASSCAQHPWLPQAHANRMHFGYPDLPDGYLKNFTTTSDSFGRAVADDVSDAYDLKHSAWQLVARTPRDTTKKTSGAVDVHVLASMDPDPVRRAYWHQMQVIVLGAMGLFEDPARRAQSGKNLLSKMALGSGLRNAGTAIPEVDPQKHYMYDVQGARDARMRDGQAFAYPLECSLTWVLHSGQHRIGQRGLGIPAAHYVHVSEVVPDEDFPSSFNVSIQAKNITSRKFEYTLAIGRLLLRLMPGASARNELGNMDMAYTAAWANLSTHNHLYYHLNNDYVLGQIPEGNVYKLWTPHNLQHTYRSKGAVLPHFITYRRWCFAMFYGGYPPAPSAFGPGFAGSILGDKSKSDNDRRANMRLHLMLSEAY